MTKKFTSTIAGASILLTGVGLMSRGLGLVREMVFAGSFGLGEEFDVYLVGAILPLTIQVIILFLIQNYIIPAYNKLLAEKPEQKDEFIRSNFWIFTFAGLVLALIMFLSSDFIINAYMSGSSLANKETARIIFNLLLITIPLSSGNSVLISFLQNKMNFLTPAIARLMTNVAIIIIVFALSSIYGTLIIPLGYILGEIIALLILLYKTEVKIFSSFRNLIHTDQLKSSLSINLLMIVLIESISQLYSISDRYFINSVQPGGIAALNYAQILFVLPITTLSMALSTAIFPKLSQNYSSGSMVELERQFVAGIRINILLFVPIMLIFLLNGDEIIRVFYQRGKFTTSDTLMTTSALKYLSVSLIFYSIYSILNKMIYSARLIKFLLILTVIGVAIKIALNFLLVDIFYQNGLALSSSISYIFFFFVSISILARRLPFLTISNISKEFNTSLNGCNFRIYHCKNDI